MIEDRADIRNSIIAMQCVALIPLKLSHPKTRLSNLAGEKERRRFVQSLCNIVIAAADATPEITRIVVLCDQPFDEKPSVATPVEIVTTPEPLNSALCEYAHTKITFENALLIAHADLAYANDFSHTLTHLNDHDIVFSPDRHKKGTNVVAHSPLVEVPYAFGDNSLLRHTQWATKNHYRYVISHEPELMCDIDTPHDYAHFVSTKQDIKNGATRR